MRLAPGASTSTNVPSGIGHRTMYVSSTSSRPSLTPAIGCCRKRRTTVPTRGAALRSFRAVTFVPGASDMIPVYAEFADPPMLLGSAASRLRDERQRQRADHREVEAVVELKAEYH